MLAADTAGTLDTVALLTESVDRNSRGNKAPNQYTVALLTESVDRNIAVRKPKAAALSRSPHGERG